MTTTDDTTDTLPPKGDNGGPTMGPDVTQSEANLTQENRTLGVKLSISQAFHQMVLRGYDALLHHGINYRELPQHKDTTLLDKGLASDLESGRVHILEWLKRVESSIVAAVRRKGFKEV